MSKSQPSPYCPSCDHELQKEEINITEGVALCAECGQISRLSDLNFLDFIPSTSLNKIPRKIKITSDRRSLKIKVSLFSLFPLIGCIFISLFWNGITSLFLSLAVSAVCFNTLGYVPDWLPAPGLEEGKPVMNDQVMGVGMTVILCLFLTPFVTIGIGMLINTLLYLCGSTIISLDRDKSYTSTGILFLRRKKSFDPKNIKTIKMATSHKGDDQTSHLIEMVTNSDKTIKFARKLNDRQQQWLITILKQVIIYKRPSSSTTNITPLEWLK